jgi:hypothetical protein
MSTQDELPWLDELNSIISLPRLEILRCLWATSDPVDTFTVSKQVHLSMEETYDHLKRLTSLGIVEEVPGSADTGRKLWRTTSKELRLEILADQGGVKYSRSMAGSAKAVSAPPKTDQGRKGRRLDVAVGALIGGAFSFFGQAMYAGIMGQGFTGGVVANIAVGVFLFVVGFIADRRYG